MENKENNKIDELFNKAGKKAEENDTFPAFDKVWDKVEKRLDEKSKKKNRIIPIWLPYGIAAGLALTFGILYFTNKSEAPTPKSIIVQNNPNKNSENQNNSESDNSSNIQKIDSGIQNNIKKIPIDGGNEMIAYHDAVATTPIEVQKINRVELETIDMPAPIKNSEAPPIISNHLETSTGVYNAPPPPPSTGSKASIVERSSSDIESVVVTAEGIKRNKMTASYPRVSADALIGTVAGISVEPKKREKIVIRGVSSIKNTSQPLYVVDGLLYDKNIITALNPSKINSVTVLKNAAATSLYGSRGQNGVVVIMTKDLSRKERRKLNKDLKNLIPSTVEEKKIEVKEPKEEPEQNLPKAGQLTAGEVNDFSKWNYWQDIAVPALDEYKKSWKFFPERRVSVQLLNQEKKPVIGEKIQLLDDKKNRVWEGISDNLGNAELWISPRIDSQNTSTKFYIADAAGKILSDKVKEFKDGQNLIYVHQNCLQSRNLDLVFVVDATGSMGDEIRYLQSELLDVLKKVESNLKKANVRYGSVFYRDRGDEYITRKFDFSNKAEDLIGFIKKQRAAGGGDTPEAVVEALEETIDNLNWSKENSTKLMFLILDAPPHWSEENINKLFEKIKLAAKKGITIIPLAASDTDKQTEYLMRAFALLTNGTYTFLTNHSGIGNNHIEPTTSEYEVEKLNELFLRLIMQRASVPDCEKGLENEYLNKKLEVETMSEKSFTAKIFPNPTKGNFKIQSVAAIDEVHIYDYTGKVLMKKEKLIKGINDFDISAYPQSVYLIRLKYGTNWETFKIIKN